MNEHEAAIVKRYQIELARKGGLAGKGKKREQLDRARKIRWDKYRARKAAEQEELVCRELEKVMGERPLNARKAQEVQP